MVNFHHLRLFVTVADLRSFSKAALELGLTQPSVSRAIKELEEEWNGLLFYRTGRGVVRSEFGQSAYADAKRILEMTDQLTDDLRSQSPASQRAVTIGIASNAVAHLIPNLVDQVHERLPNVHLKIYDGFTHQIERWLSTGLIDVGICSRYCTEEERKPEMLRAEPLLVFYASNTKMIPPTIEFSALGGLPLLLPSRPNGARKILDRLARLYNVRLNVALECNSHHANLLLAERRQYYAFGASLPDPRLQLTSRFSHSQIIKPSVYRFFQIATTKERPLSKIAREVAKSAKVILKG